MSASDPELWWRLPAALTTAMAIAAPFIIVGVWIGAKIAWWLFLAGRP